MFWAVAGWVLAAILVLGYLALVIYLVFHNPRFGPFK